MMRDGLVIYSRRDCSLCEQMEAAVREVAGPGVAVTLVDIDDVPALVERFGRDIPVLCLDGEVVCKHVLDAERLRSVLDGG